jgi:apolipoprotein N-acyltransferase
MTPRKNTERSLMAQKDGPAVSADEDASRREVAGSSSILNKPASRRLKVLLMGVFGLGLLSLAFPPLDLWPLAYVGLIPWVLMLDAGASRRWELFCAWLTGLAFWMGNLYWLTWVTLLGYAGTVAILSGYFWLSGVILRPALRRGWPMMLVLPLVWVACEYLRAYVLGGFPWFFLAHSQYQEIHLIQIADATGVYGLSFFVAMVNGALIDLWRMRCRYRQERRPAGFSLAVTVVVPLMVWGWLLAYGDQRISQWSEHLHEGPVIGLVQQAFPLSLFHEGASPEKIFAEHLRASETFVGQECDLVLWPETMLPAGMNLDPKHFSDPEVRQKLREESSQMADLSLRLECPILAGGITYHMETPDEEGYPGLRNSALWFDGKSAPEVLYSKQHLVPFSEYVPVGDSWPAFYRLLRKFVPGAMAQLQPGKINTPFTLRRGERQWRLVSPICYEGTFARVCRGMAYQGGRKRADILANLSNDGWFVYQRKGASPMGSTEQRQHLAHYCFRAVENRTPVVRAVNTGISASIDSSGRIVAVAELEIDDYRKQVMVPATLLLDGKTDDRGNYLPGRGPQVLVDDRITLYSLWGDWFARIVSFSAAVLAAMLMWAWRADARVKKVIPNKRNPHVR